VRSRKLGTAILVKVIKIARASIDSSRVNPLYLFMFFILEEF